MDCNLKETLFWFFIGVTCANSVLPDQRSITSSTPGPPLEQESGDSGENTQVLSASDDEEITTAELSSNLGKRDVGGFIRCRASPPGMEKPCIFCNGEFSNKVTDDNGNTCECSICVPGQIVKQSCSCYIDGTVQHDTICDVVKSGDGFMPESNLCEKPYPCTDCTGDFIRVRGCVGADDSSCDCPRQYHQTGPDLCSPIPLCDEDYERTIYQDPDSIYPSFICVPCPEGQYQPFNDSVEPCRLRPSTTQPALISKPTDPSDSTCPPCPIMDCPTPTISDLCNSAVEQISDKGHIIALLALGLFIPVAFLLGRFPKGISFLIDYFTNSHGSYTVTERANEEEESEESGSGVDNPEPDPDLEESPRTSAELAPSDSANNNNKVHKGKKTKKKKNKSAERNIDSSGSTLL